VSTEQITLLTAAIFVVAFLYSSVGHAGASGYIAIMSLASVPAATIRPVALVLNIVVACISSWQFWRAGHFSWRMFWPFALLSAPCAFLGGYIHLPTMVLKWLIGLVLLFSAYRFFTRPYPDEDVTPPGLPAALGAGAALGFLAGLTGTGGGIFLTPLLILKRWARTKVAAAVSALFILVNSLAGLAGNYSATRFVPLFATAFVVAAIAGGLLGSYLGSKRLPATAVKKMLACVLVIAGLKLLLT
jgi:uncharacterized membrane protein YfcA